jgi:hypothetical protein
VLQYSHHIAIKTPQSKTMTLHISTLHNEELDVLQSSPTIVRVIK